MSLKNISAKRSSISNDEMMKKLKNTQDHVDPIIADNAMNETAKGTGTVEAVAKASKKKNVGRKKSENPKDVSFAVYLTAEEAEEMKAYCEKEDRSTSFFIRRAIQNELARIKEN